MLHIGLTGGIASGKSLVSHYFHELQVPIIDMDLIAKKLTQPHTDYTLKIIEKFGDNITSASKEIDRKALRTLVFSDPQARLWLEELLHPAILKDVKHTLTTLHAPYCVIVIPLLTDRDQFDFIDRILVIDCPSEIQEQRLVDRDHCNLVEAKRIMDTQLSRDKRNVIADDIINNDSSTAHLSDTVAKLHSLYTHLASNACE